MLVGAGSDLRRGNSAAQCTRPLIARFVRWQRDERRAPRAGRLLEDWPTAVLAGIDRTSLGVACLTATDGIVLPARSPASAKDNNSSSVRSSMLRIIRTFCVWIGLP